MKLIWNNNKGEPPQSGKGNRLSGSPGSLESPKEVGPKEEHTKYIVIKLPKIKYKERILKEATGKERVTYKGVSIWLSANFSKEILQEEVFKVMKSKDLYPRLLYPAQVSFRMEGQIKCFPDKVKLKEFTITKPLYEMLKELT